ncbi:hypothetical protein T06_14924 [Trichinella sp. T6]|nr:hypothetical protein T06_14924 [Trichinella sp. T6]
MLVLLLVEGLCSHHHHHHHHHQSHHHWRRAFDDQFGCDESDSFNFMPWKKHERRNAQQIQLKLKK